MKGYVKEFFHRGLIFGGFGPIIVGVVFYILSITAPDFNLSGKQILLAIVSTYVLAFLQAGASIFNQIEEWPITKSLLYHFLTVYIAYVVTYLINSWIPFIPEIIAVFTAIFVFAYLIIWFTVYYSVKIMSKKMNKKI